MRLALHSACILEFSSSCCVYHSLLLFFFFCWVVFCCVYTIVCLNSDLLKDIWIVSSFWFLWINLHEHLCPGFCTGFCVNVSFYFIGDIHTFFLNWKFIQLQSSTRGFIFSIPSFLTTSLTVINLPFNIYTVSTYLLHM